MARTAAARQGPEAEAFHRALRDLHLAAGAPTYRDISDAVGVSHSWPIGALKGPGVPEWPLIDKFARYLTSDEETHKRVRELWEAAWVARRDNRGAPPTSQPGSGLVTVRRIERILAATDTCLIAIEDGRPLPAHELGLLPPYRRVLLESIAEQVGIEE